ncbi:MAG: coenzyme F420-0:L-glutamate ligase, partial [Actinomycetota bacterium]|nr:coenzyme F420-0:L-glutamate ligase [Actinomycetota bacterium]
MTALVVTPLRGMPEVAAGDDLATLVLVALGDNALTLQDGDVLVVSSKIASKAMGLTVETVADDPTTEREAVVAAQSEWVVAERRTAGRTTSVVKARSGPVMAAAGVDASNTGGLDLLLLLPHDPDAVCRDLHRALVAATGVRRLGIVLS